MTNSNQVDSLVAIRQSLQAREILVKLDAYGGSGNDEIFYKWLPRIGLAISSRDLAELLDRLEHEALISSEMVDRCRVLKLTRHGQETAAGIDRVEWIAVRELVD